MDPCRAAPDRRSLRTSGRTSIGLLRTALPAALILASSSCGPEADLEPVADVALEGIPTFEPATDWPGPLPEHWLIGPGTGIYVDDEDIVWALHRPERISPDDFAAAEDPSVDGCCVAAPPLLKIGTGGALLGEMGSVLPDPSWPLMPHGVFVDHEGYVWVATSIHHQVMKFTPEGALLLTIGVFDEVGGSNDTTLLGGAADVYVDPETNEVFVADGYENRRVFTGARPAGP